MCGIAGFISPHAGESVESRKQLLASMCRVITHRGPDEQGTVVRGRAALGMRRLSIIDLKTGQQPIFTPDERFAIVFNGEIYNYRELKAQLEGKGYQFRTNSDTETILYAYQEFGSCCVEYLRGMFAFAIWDFEEETLFLARDRVGKKPLFYGTAPDGTFVFGSELKSPMLYPGIDRAIDPSALDAYLAFGYVPESHCIFKTFRKLAPGCTLIFRRSEVSLREYWDFPETFVHDPRTEEDYSAELRETLKEAVDIRLLSEVPLGAFLSGGIDSSAVVAFMSQISKEPVKTFSIGFEEDRFNELQHARKVASLFGTDHHEFIVRPDVVELVDEIVWHFDEPFGDSSALPTYIVSKMAREYVSVVLSGDGGDEIFGGYTRYAVHRDRSTFRKIPFPIRKLLGGLGKHLPSSAWGKNFLHNISLNSTDQYIDLVSLWNFPSRRQLYSKEFFEGLSSQRASAEQEFRDIAESRNFPSGISKLMYLDSKTYLPSDIMTKVDRMTMANSLEARSPFLDPKVIEFASRVPDSLKLNGSETKYILKKAMEGILPSEILYREKQGFGVPLVRWINDELRSKLRDTLLDERATARGLFDRKYIETILQEHHRGRRDHSHALWTLFMLELWYVKVIDNLA